MKKKIQLSLFKFLKISVLAFVMLYSFSAQAQVQGGMCIDLFKSRHQIIIDKILESLQTDIRKLPGAWLEGLDRDGAENLTNVNYVRNVTQSTMWTFSSWFKNPFTTKMNFLDLLRKQHSETIYGRSIDKKKWYLPRLVTAEMAEEHLQPGVFRSDAKYKRNADLEFISLQPRYFEGYLSEAEVMQMAQKPPGTTTHIEGIPVEAQTRTIGFFKPGDLYKGKTVPNATVLFSYADPKYIPIYLARMESTMREINRLYFAERTPENQMAAVKLLGRYHQLFINALPFGRVNNSIVMAQINYILLEFGLNPVRHGSMDFVCLMISSDRYEKMFVQWIQHFNGGQPQP